MVYLGAQKKALIQSMPYLALLLIPVLRVLRGDAESGKILTMLVVPAIYVLFFSHWNDHGGLCINLRYFIPVLPFTSILTAYVVREYSLCSRPKLPSKVLCLVALSTGMLFMALLAWCPKSYDAGEIVVLIMPMALSAILAAAIIMNEATGGRALSPLLKIGVPISVCAMVWAGMTAFYYDFPNHRAQRKVNYKLGGLMLQVIPSNSIVFTYPWPDPVFRLIEKDHVRLAFPDSDNFRDVPRLTDYYLNHGTNVFGVMPEEMWDRLSSGPLANYRYQDLVKGKWFSVRRILGKRAKLPHADVK